MRRTSAYSISLLVISFCSLLQAYSQDTIVVPLKIKAGLEVSGPAIHYFDNNILNTEGYIAVDLNEKISAVLAGGYVKYKYLQYNYSFNDKGMFFRTGLDFNLLKPDKSKGRYYTGIGLRYGLGVFTSETPSFTTMLFFLRSAINARSVNRENQYAESTLRLLAAATTTVADT